MLLKKTLNKIALMALGLMSLTATSAMAEVVEQTGKISAYTFDSSYRLFYMDGIYDFCGSKTPDHARLDPNQSHIKFDMILRAAFHAGKTVTIKSELQNGGCHIRSVQVYQHQHYSKLKQ